MARRRPLPPARPILALRGLVAVGAAGVVAAGLVGRASGNLDPVADVFVGIPASAGLITTSAPVRSAAAKSKKPLPRNRLLVGQTAAAAPQARSRARSSSSRWMQCAYTLRGRSSPNCSYTAR